MLIKCHGHNSSCASVVAAADFFLPTDWKSYNMAMAHSLKAFPLSGEETA